MPFLLVCFLSSKVVEDQLLVRKEPLRVWCRCDGADSVGRDLTREQKAVFTARGELRLH